MKVVGKDYIDYWQAMSANLQGQKKAVWYPTATRPLLAADSDWR